MVKFIFFSFIFHLTLLAVFKLETVDFKKNKDRAFNVNLSLEKKTDKEKEKPKKEIKSKKTDKEIEKPKKEIKSKKTDKEIEKTKKEISKKTVKEKEKPKKTVKEIEKPKKKIKHKKATKEKEKTKNSNEENFDDLLKNLAEEKLPLDSQDNFEKKLQKLSEQKLNNSNDLNKKKPNANELNSIEKLILNQIDENWSRPPGIKISKDLVIKVIVRLDINGNVISLQIHENTLNETVKEKTLQPYLESAIRAIKKTSPFEGLKKDRYNNWKELIINFKPIEAR